MICAMEIRHGADIARIEAQSHENPWTSERFVPYMSTREGYLGLIWSVHDVVQGFLCAQFVAPEGEIHNVAVSAGSRRRGIARALTVFVLEEARHCGVEAIFLEVRESNLAARRLYESLGFQLAGRRPAYYRPSGEDALVMRIGLGSLATD